MAKQKSFINEKAVVKILKKSDAFILKYGEEVYISDGHWIVNTIPARGGDLDAFIYTTFGALQDGDAKRYSRGRVSEFAGAGQFKDLMFFGDEYEDARYTGLFAEDDTGRKMRLYETAGEFISYNADFVGLVNVGTMGGKIDRRGNRTRECSPIKFKWEKDAILILPVKCSYAHWRKYLTKEMRLQRKTA